MCDISFRTNVVSPNDSSASSWTVAKDSETSPLDKGDTAKPRGFELQDSLSIASKYQKRRNLLKSIFVCLHLLTKILYIYDWFIFLVYCMKKGNKIWFLLFILRIFSSSISFASEWNLPWVDIISRAERWADESIRLRSTPKTSSTSTWTKTEAQIKAENISKIRNNWMSENFPNERKYEWTKTMSWNMYLTHPERFNYHKTKIVIHHTAMDYDSSRNEDDIKLHLQKIYKYHTINRNFGDIGYNFLIDQLWNIYEWRAWWEWAIWMHVAHNNVATVWISLLWNFEKDTPTEAQLSSLINLTTALAKFYNIDPLWTSYTFQTNTSKEPYVTAKKNFTILWHRDIAATSCPGKNVYPFLDKLRDEVDYRLKNNIIENKPLPSSRVSDLSNIRLWNLSKNNQKSDTSNDSQSSITNANTQSTGLISAHEQYTWHSNMFPNLLKLYEKNPKTLLKAAQRQRSLYTWSLSYSSNPITKISKKISIDEISNLIHNDISVLLYQLTTEYKSFEIKCDSKCIFDIDGEIYERKWADLTFLNDKIYVDWDQKIIADRVNVKSTLNGGKVEISNYDRKSYAWIPRNVFKWELVFKKWTYPLLDGTQIYNFIVINKLPFSEYMKWIVETNDTESLEKNKVMAMISKNYALFYMDRENVHPNILSYADYNAIDDPRFFQKYVWAWLEKTLTKRYQALEATKNEVVMYDDFLPILPYFNCSAWFTLSGREKRWWNDTPYLKSVFDFDSCDDFIWHWVWLSGKWAEWLAQKWVKYSQILKYYYDWIHIESIN